MATWSTRLATGTVTVAQNRVLAFTVPMGHRVVVKYACTQQATAAGAAVLFYLGSGGPWLARVDSTSGDPGTSVEMRLTLHEGEQLYVRALINAADFSLHGYLLDGAGAPLVPGTLPH